ncbi:MAG: sensor histidine kinase [Gaiellales bacterium]
MTDQARQPSTTSPSAAVEAQRGRVLIEESREVVVVLDATGAVIAASRRARESIAELREGEPLPERLLSPDSDRVATAVPYDIGGETETLLYLTEPGELAAYEELRAGFTASVSHELRTPLARLLSLLESAQLPGADVLELVRRGESEIEQIRELIDDVLFLSELETGKELVALGSTPALQILREVADGLTENAARAGVRLRVSGDESLELPLRPRMIRVIAQNLAQNSIRYAGEGAAFTLHVGLDDGSPVLTASDDGAGVAEHELPRLFERFYRADSSRVSRGTGLGLAIVKHVVTSADGTIGATSAPGEGLTITCTFRST